MATLRTIVRAVLINDPALELLGVVDLGVRSGDVDTPMERPFLVLRWGTTTPGLDVVNNRTLTIWVHDNKSSGYARIDSVIKRIRVLFNAVEGVPHDDGHLIKLEWVTDSDDLVDPGHGTITRTTTHNIVGTGM